MRAGVLVAQPFDPSQRVLSGEAVPALQGGQDLVEVGARSLGRVCWCIDDQRLHRTRSSGRTEAESGAVSPRPRENTQEPALSRDERRLAFARPTANALDVWVHELDRGITSRLTTVPPLNNMPVWSPDGRTIVFATARNGGLDIYQRPANGAGSDQPLVSLSGQPVVIPSDWSRDGRFLTYYRTDPKTRLDTWVLPFEGDQKPFALLQSDFNESQGQFSPDAKWIAYISDQSGTPQVYVQSFPKPTEQQQISTNGGSQPRWRSEGRELFYLSADGKLMVVQVKTGDTFVAGSPQALFSTQLPRGALRQSYDVSADGQRFLLYEPLENAGSAVNVVVNLPALLKR